jgi:pimeloyl-ACP methyl ester carboxylesterase
MERTNEQLALKMPGGQTIRGIYSFTTCNTAAPAVIFAHGFGSNRVGEKSSALEAECVRRGWAFAACDFRGHGESDGTMLELRCSRLIEDLDSITAEVAKRTSGKIFLFGSSLGGWTSAWFAARNPDRVAGCALVAPAFHFLEFRRLSEEQRREWQRIGRLRWQNEFIDVEVEFGLTAEARKYPMEMLASEFRTPSIIFHGMADDLVPYRDSIEFTERCLIEDIELLLFKRGDHRLNRESEKMARLACDFWAAN